MAKRNSQLMAERNSQLIAEYEFNKFRVRKIFELGNFWIENSVFRQFGEVLEDLQPNGRQNQLPRQILLQIGLF